VVEIVADPPEVLSLLADPHRWRLLTELAASDRRVGELTALLDAPQNLVSYHLRELRSAGLVASRRSSADGRDVYYRADLRRCGDLLAAAGGRLHPVVALAPPAHPPRPGRARRRPRVLFLCTGNSSRSQMAEALLVERSGGHVLARSAGSHPKALHPQAVAVMAGRGIDIAGNQAKPLERFVRQRFDRVITLCDKVREVCPELPGHPDPTHWSMPDPAAEPDADSTAPFERTADELEERLAVLLAELTQPEGSPHGR
jgi:protein-tyrosine-phosphatase/DNA-binding transcriptional ArsR family regulator